MYPRKGKILPKYSVIVNQNDDEKIRISELVMTDNQCLVNIRAAIERPEYSYSIEDFFDQNIFKKPAVKKHVNKAVKKGLDEDEDKDEDEDDEEDEVSGQKPIDKANLKIEEGRKAIDELFRQESQQIAATSAATSAATIVEVNKGTKKLKENKSKKGGSKKVQRQSNKYSKRRR
jgi:hypothetical protein